MIIERKLNTMISAVLLIIALLSQHVYAQQKNIYTLDELIKTGLENNYDIRKAEAELAKADALMEQARSGYIPDFSIKRIDTKFDNFGATGSEKGYSNSVEMVTPIYMGGKIGLGLKTARAMHKMARTNLINTKEKAVFQIASAYFNLLKAEDGIAVIKESVEQVESHKKIAQAAVNAGKGLENDVLRTEVSLGSLKQILISAQSGYLKSKLALENALGTKLNNDFKLSRITPPENKFILPENPVENAVEKRNDLRALREYIRISELAVGIAKGDNLPQIAVAGSRTEGDKITPVKDNWSVSVVTEWKLFDGGLVSGQVNEKRAELDAVKIQYEQLISGIRIELLSGKYDMEAAFEKIKVAEIAVKQAQESLRITKAQYENGMITSVTVLDDEVLLSKMKNDYYEAVYDYHTAVFRIKLALGEILED